MILNIVASSLPIILLQLVLLPLLSRNMSSGKYGLVLTILSILNVVPSTLGNCLNNIRLLHRNDYSKKEVIGDFNIILLRNSIVVFLSVTLLCVYYFGKGYFDESKEIHITLIVVLALLWMGREYFSTSFYAYLRYDKIFVSNILLCVGYIIGYVFYEIIKYWELVYIVGYILSIIYIMKNSDLWKEPLVKTRLFYDIQRDYIIYVFSCILSRLITYSDKMLLYPLLGGAQVAIYYVATLMGKVILLVVAPISNVIFSYLTKTKYRNQGIFFLALKLGSVMCATGYFFCVFVSRPVLAFIYPAYVGQAMKYIYITSGTTVIRVFEGLINPFVLCFVTMKWQIVINLFTLILYIGLSFLFLSFFDLYGFCMGALFADLLKLLLMIMIYKFLSK